MIVKLTSLYKLQNIKCSVFEQIIIFLFRGGGFSPVSPLLRTPLYYTIPSVYLEK